MIDLRSDTVTRPTEPMRLAMSRAEVGDDVYDEDPSVRALQEQVAGLLGHEAALFCPTGSLSNLLGVRGVAPVGTEVLCESSAHVVRAELGAHAAVNGTTTRTWTHPRGLADPAAIAAMVAPDLGPYFVATSTISLENTHNFAGGTVSPLSLVREVRELADAHGLAVHLDGARLANASVATGEPMGAFGALADVVSLCLSKGLGAPVGSLVVGSADLVADARTWRKRLGGGWRQAGVLAAAGSYALDHHVERLAEDHARARVLAAACGVDPAEVDTNIVVVPCHDTAAVVRGARDAGVLVGAVGPRTLRVVTHLDVDDADVAEAAGVLGRLLDV